MTQPKRWHPELGGGVIGERSTREVNVLSFGGGELNPQSVNWECLNSVIGCGAKEPELPLLPEFICGECGFVFGSNCGEDDIECPECGSRACPHCHNWFGGV